MSATNDNSTQDEASALFTAVSCAISERLSLYGISQTGTIERDITAAALIAIRGELGAFFQYDEEGCKDLFDLAISWRDVLDAAILTPKA
tara:strand:+ start:288 stop:557 length:270 start_codon:yes stop_codon:yes gene_type:complete